MTGKGFEVYCIVFFSLIIFSGCSIKETTKNAADTGDLRERVNAYWQYKVKEDFMKSYEYEVPYYRKNVSMVNYIKGINTDVGKYISATPGEIKPQGDSALVEVKLRVRVTLPQMRSEEYNVIITEKWVKSDGMWYHVPEIVDQRSVD
ncbi:MAG: hypothetical protein M0Z71_09085 [Nitrospiraceae bacterium]|nr:hypothetical protein [Nitrospiraceae bacterium]